MQTDIIAGYVLVEGDEVNGYGLWNFMTGRAIGTDTFRTFREAVAEARRQAKGIHARFD